MGIIANPASGKDIRRLVAHATTVDNRGKISIIRRALVGLGAMGVERVAIMPDSHALGERALKGLDRRATIPSVTMLDMAMVHGAKDSQRAAEQLCQNGARCILILGGDGTIRVVSKGAGQIPLLPILAFISICKSLGMESNNTSFFRIKSTLPFSFVISRKSTSRIP